MTWGQDFQLRRVYLNEPHSANPKPSWYGESVGHYENGDTLVVDTIGMNDRTYVDNYRTPHTTQLHVVERFKLVDGGDATGSQCPRRGPRRLYDALERGSAVPARPSRGGSPAPRNGLRREQ